jgi:NAD(P)-dependent dehydrogenase (short-subunit alcohol dehydrogenase family)
MFQTGLLKDKVVLVTGGGTGLGRSMASRFLELGAKVAIASRRQDVIETAAHEMAKKFGSETLGVACDVRDPEAVKAMMDAVETKLGPIDVLLNNAAGNFISPTERLSTRAFDTVLNIVLHGTVYCTLDIGKRWIERKQKGTVLNIATTYALAGSGYVVPSATAKAGVIAMTKSLAAEWGKYGIRLNAIAPGPFPTEGAWSRLMPTKEIEKMFDSRIPLKRVGEHIELANLAAYLISDMAAYITGDVITIDGGETVWGAGEFNILDAVTPDQWDALEAMRKKG